MWSITDYMPAAAQQLTHGMVLIAVLWIVLTFILAMVALLKAPPEHLADVIKAFSHWWPR